MSGRVISKMPWSARKAPLTSRRPPRYRSEGEERVQASEVPRAIAAAMSTAWALDLTVDDAIVLNDSNRLALHLLPCDVLARVAHAGTHVAEFEVELARLLAESDSPVGVLEPRVDPRAYERDG